MLRVFSTHIQNNKASGRKLCIVMGMCIALMVKILNVFNVKKVM